MAKKPAVKKAPMSQKLGTGSKSGVSGLDLNSKLEKASAVQYKGYDQGSVRHGAHGLLAATGGKKNAKVPQG